jgi:hypothetical protein
LRDLHTLECAGMHEAAAVLRDARGR